MTVGVKGDGTCIQTGGSVTSRAGVTVGGTLGDGYRGFYHISGGALTACTGTQSFDTGLLLVGAQDGGTGTFIQSGGVVTTKDLTINENAAVDASMTVSGGSLLVVGHTINHGALTLSGGSISMTRIDGSGVMAVNGTASLTMLQIRQQSLSLGGDAVITPSGSGVIETTHRLRALSFGQVGPAIKGKWDLGRDGLAVDYAGASPIAAIRSYLVSGRGTGSWSGTGLASSIVPLTNGKHALGYAEASDVLGPTGGQFRELIVDGTAVLVKYTYTGDANLDGKVDVADLGRLATHWQGAGEWSDGDFDYNGVVNVGDRS